MKELVLTIVYAFLLSSLPTRVAAQSLAQRIDVLLADQFPTDGPGAVIYLAQGDQVLYKKALGKANIELEVAMQPEYTFRLGSITKQFTACAILKLAEEGKLTLRDDIHKYIPDYPIKSHEISIEALLTHTAGVKNYTGLSSFTEALKRKDLTPKELVDLFKNEALEFAPKTGYKYSNSGYILLGYIIEKVTGKSYANYMEEAIFKPLGMKNTQYDNALSLVPGRVPGYTPRNGVYRNADYLSMTVPYAAGALISTAEDLQKWYIGLHNGKILRPETLKKAFSSYSLENGQLTGYGYGWEIGNVQQQTTVKHVGVINGFSSYTAYMPTENLSISILKNYESSADADILASKILALQLGQPYAFNPISLSVQELEPYQGIYNLENAGEHTIRLQDGQLMYYPLGGRKSRLIPYRKDHFVLENSLTSLSFEKDQEGNVKTFTLQGTGLASRGSKTSTKVDAQQKINLSVAQMDKYIGKYQFEPGPVFEITMENQILYGQVGKDRKELVPYAKHSFFARDLDAVIIFNNDKQNHIHSLTKIQNSEMKAKKL